MKVSLQNCSLEIKHIGTREEIDTQIFLEEFPRIAQNAAEAFRIGLASAFEDMSLLCAQLGKKLKEGF